MLRILGYLQFEDANKYPVTGPGVPRIARSFYRGRCDCPIVLAQCADDRDDKAKTILLVVSYPMIYIKAHAIFRPYLLVLIPRYHTGLPNPGTQQ